MHIEPAMQTAPQVPQFLASLSVFTQAPPQTVSSPLQFGPQWPAWQGVPLAQTCPQAPQFAGSVCRLTHTVAQSC